MNVLDAIQRTGDARWPIVPRVVAGGPLLVFGLAHLAGALPMEPLLRAAGWPAPNLMGVVGSAVEALAGLLLLAGWMSRAGGALGAGAMAGAIAVHLAIPDDRWPQPGSGLAGPEPVGMLMLACVVLVCCGVVAAWGSGVWGMDRGQVARRASSRGGGMEDAPAVKRVKRRKGEAVKEGESVW